MGDGPLARDVLRQMRLGGVQAGQEAFSLAVQACCDYRLSPIRPQSTASKLTAEPSPLPPSLASPFPQASDAPAPAADAESAAAVVAAPRAPEPEDVCHRVHDPRSTTELAIGPGGTTGMVSSFRADTPSRLEGGKASGRDNGGRRVVARSGSDGSHVERSALVGAGPGRPTFEVAENEEKVIGWRNTRVVL